MRWQHLKAEIARLERAGLLNDWTETGVESFDLSTGEPIWATDDSEAMATLKLELEDRKTEVTSLEAAVKQAEKDADGAAEAREKAETEAEALREEMARLRDPESGVTVVDYRKERDEAEADAERSREQVRLWAAKCDRMTEELSAMRKRKGVEPGVMACTRDVMALLHGLASNRRADGTPRWDENAARELERREEQAGKLLERINAAASAGAAKVAAAKAGQTKRAA